MLYTDRSRFKTHFKCPFERYLNYHYSGIGIVRSGLSIPLITGSYAHNGIEAVLHLVSATNSMPSAKDVRDIVANISSNYTNDVLAAGFTSQEENDSIGYVIQEQTTLISGLLWSWSVYVLPQVLERYTILHIEQEMERVVGCTCGLASLGTVAEHIARDCAGVVVMTRPDIVAESSDTGSVVYIELKTGSRIDSGTFEGDVQFAFGAAGIECYTGKPLSESYVHALSKGYRGMPKTKTDDSFPYQQSSLCYAYVNQGIAGMVPQDISFKYTSKKGYKRTPVWEIIFKNIPAGVPVEEHYISLMDDEELASHVNILGPYPYPKQQVEEMLIEIQHLEKRIDPLYRQIDSEVADKGLADPDVQTLLHENIPKGWTCRTYNSICPYYHICTKLPGWEDPLSILDREGKPMYVIRDPNHPIEGSVE